MKKTFVIPAGALLAAVRTAAMFCHKDPGSGILSGIALEVETEAPESHVTIVALDGYRIYHQTLPELVEKYPNWQAVIPEQPPGRLVCDRDALLGALLALPGQSRDGCLVSLQIERDMATAEPRLRLAGKRGEVPMVVSIPCESQGEFAERTFNCRFLAQAVKSMPSGPVQIAYAGPNHSILVGSSVEGAQVAQALLMPFRS